MSAKVRINLLDWRAERRAKRQKQFMSMLVLAGIATALLVGLVFTYFNGRIEHQKARNNFLRAEIQQIEKQIKEIEELEKVKQDLLARMQVIERLQQSRAKMVHFFDELVSTLPEGVTLKALVQKGDEVTFEGEAESNGRVSAYMKNLDASDWFDNPRLIVIKTSSAKSGGRNSNFTLKVQHVSPKPEEGDDLVEETP